MSVSSKALREELNRSQVENHVPSVDNSVSISKYFEHGNLLYKEAVSSYTKAEWRYAYVQFKIFLHFSLQVRRHNAFNLPQHTKAKNWLKRANESAFKMIDVVVARLDELEELAARQQEELLNDEFYGSSSDDEAVPQTSLPRESDEVPAGALPAGFPVAAASDAGSDALSDAASALSLDFPAAAEIPAMRPSKDLNAPSEDSLSKALSLLKGPAAVTLPTHLSVPIIPTASSGYYPETIASNVHSAEDVELLKATLDGVRNKRYMIPAPHRESLQLTLGGCVFVCNKDDFYVSFSSFLNFLPPDMQLCRPVVETNRCFFIHLGVATGFHPFLLQVYFRKLAGSKLKSLPPDDVQCELLQSVLLPAGFVDANVLCTLWPREFSERRYRICFLCGSLTRPMFIIFTPDDVIVQSSSGPFYDIVLYCDGSHFTFLQVTQMRHQGGCAVPNQALVIDQIVRHANDAKYIVQEHFVKNSSSIGELLEERAY